MNRTAVAQEINSENNSAHSGGILQCKCASCSSKTTAIGECVQSANKSSKLQRKLSIGLSNDPLEHEADHVADQVMSMSPNSGIARTTPKIQRASTSARASGSNVPASVNRTLSSSGRPMQSGLRQDMENHFSQDFSQVRVHTGTVAEQSARDVDAHAYTVGQNIVFGAGQFSSETRQGRRLLAHELTHVVQQSSSVSSVTTRLQRTIGDGHDLSASRFSRNRILEAVFDNERLLQSGSSGTAVRLIQESLVAQGYVLPIFGADGDFGAETETAVRQFQIDTGAVTLDGIIGQETMQLLDMHDNGITRATGPRAIAPPAGAPAVPPSTGVAFSEEAGEQFAGYDASVVPNWLVVPTSNRRRVRTAIAPARARPAFNSLNPAIATVDVTANGIAVTGVGSGATEIQAQEGGVTLDRLRISVKDRLDQSVAFHYVCDLPPGPAIGPAPPPHCSNGTPSADDMRSLLNRVWERQANVRFTGGAAHNVVVPGDMGPAVDWTTRLPGGGEWGTVVATGAGANYNVFRVWRYMQNGAWPNDAANLGSNTLIGDNPCADGWGLPHECGHFLGLDHPSGFIMTPCGGRANQRVSKAMVDVVNP